MDNICIIHYSTPLHTSLLLSILLFALHLPIFSSPRFPLLISSALHALPPTHIHCLFILFFSTFSQGGRLFGGKSFTGPAVPLRTIAHQFGSNGFMPHEMSKRPRRYGSSRPNASSFLSGTPQAVPALRRWLTRFVTDRVSEDWLDRLWKHLHARPHRKTSDGTRDCTHPFTHLDRCLPFRIFTREPSQVGVWIAVLCLATCTLAHSCPPILYGIFDQVYRIVSVFSGFLRHRSPPSTHVEFLKPRHLAKHILLPTASQRLTVYDHLVVVTCLAV